MPLKGDSKKVIESMKDTYDSEQKAEEVFYATANKEDRDPETWKKEGSTVLKSVLRKRAQLSPTQWGISGGVGGGLVGAGIGTAIGAPASLLYYIIQKARGRDPEFIDTIAKGTGVGALTGGGLGAGLGAYRGATRANEFNRQYSHALSKSLGHA